MKTMIFATLSILLALVGVGSNVYGQAVGDYVATTSGDYNTATNWSISNGSGGYSGIASSAPTTGTNVWIPEGKVMTTVAQANAQNMNISGELNTGNFTVQLGTTASTIVGNLTITVTGKLRSVNATGGTVNSLNVYGNTITVDGQLGAATDNNFTAYNASTNPDGGGGFRIYCLAVKSNETTTVSISGFGKINIARFYGSSQTIASAPQVININANINILNNHTTSIGAFGSMGNTGGSDRTINISVGKVVKFTGGTPKSSLHRDAVSASNYTSGDFIYNVFGSLDMEKSTIRLYTSYTSGNTKGTYLNVKSGGTLIVGDTIRLQLGQVSGQTCGIFTESGSTVKFGQGATISTQFKNNIGAAQASFPTLYYNLDVENTSGISIPNDFSIAGTLNVNQNLTGATITLLSGAKANITTGKTLTANVLKMNSSTSGTATLLNNGTVTITTANVQQYLPDARNWYVSSPVSKAAAPSGFSYYSYDETGLNPSPVPPATAYWVSVAPGADLNKGVGYIALPSTAGSTITFTTKTGETLNSGNVDVALTRSGATKTGFNLIGNPYPCHLGWTYDFVTANSSLIESSIWVRTNGGTTNSSGQWSFATFNATSAESVPSIANAGIIAPMQAFWVRAKAAGTLTLNSNLTKSHQASNPLKNRSSINSERQRIRLEVSNGVSTDEALVFVDAAAQNDYDSYDSPKMSNNSTSMPEIYTVANGQKLVINGLNAIENDMEIPMGFTTNQANTFTLRVTQLSNISADTKVYLKDNMQVNSLIELSEGQDYIFTSDVTTDNTSRFSLVFKAPSITTKSNLTKQQLIRVFSNDNNQIVIERNLVANNAVANIYNSVGQLVQRLKLNNTVTISDISYPCGTYFVTVSENNTSTTSKVIVNNI